MYPDLVDIGFLHLKTYGACMAAGFLLCWKLIEKLSGRKDLSNLLVSLMISGVVGSRVAYVIEHWTKEFASRPMDVFAVWNGGLMFYGGLILAMIVFFSWCFMKKENPLALADLLATVIPLGHACGRIGCFFYGCCYGKLSDSALAVAFPRFSPAWHEQVAAGLLPSTAARSLPVLPTQFFEAAALLVLFALLLWRWHRCARRNASPSTLNSKLITLNSSLYLMGYAIIRFGLEYLRGDPRAEIGILSISQTISLAIFLLGLTLLIVFNRGRNRV